MSKVVHPYAHRLVTLRDWKSRWFADKKYKDLLKSDVVIREFLMKKLRGFYVSRVEIDRGVKATKVMVFTSRPGMIIGRGGDGASKLKADLVSTMKKRGVIIPEDFKFDIVEVANPDADAAIVACMIAEGLEKRLPFRRVMKQTIEKVMTARGVKGARIYLGGRLGGAEIARSEQIKRGSIPLQTFRADVDFAREKAHMSYGDIGIKVWIYRGEVFSAEGGATGSKNNKQ
ncbi:30S ribosomal protein S3 [Candidatus Nomurabacteria bacterium RIFOXYC2_FULL_36_8]|uniref:30S ribosomal protein S3 n=1 Tax=uncultured organism TaxID=155900 RepID=U3GSK7_9ZZZZ|nr:30S ribosomal protein S3 [uncultured organism]KKP91486.1 MAG: 30S ribosomal protein S3 [Candidatus Nomurabacteria bacterium GW2011_GWE2_36_115]KKP94557.1 MAG: 30S ribosomal protein S3 [Candidatus Nomurabacteria bacterium GW2011_GWF2_36_126]KKP97020.1 MAG: 30S ribosomal protein S3 [Candidatus Nomurabacteria bacterium GW2011_GWD2_36_14]KKP99376.1 MAG: 30S ribosomal protein S3 [Candidatus Nomurabacteria bacterium GW2011_GWF2_36_19]KKQ05767.1 MAG: 30S ribosomal protein S3 [Candidatus Nomurabact